MPTAILPNNPKRRLLFFVAQNIDGNIRSMTRDFVQQLNGMRVWVNGSPTGGASRCAATIKQKFMYGIIHMDASGENNPPLENLPNLYDELFNSGITDGNVAVINDDNGWGISAYRNGLIIFEHIGGQGGPWHMGSLTKERVLELWRRLISGDIDGLLKEPWGKGYGTCK